MKVQIITSDQKPQFAVIPYEDWEKLQARLEELEDLVDARTLSAGITAGKEETFPDIFVGRLLSGEHPLAVWREYRGISVAALASACEVSPSTISELESGNEEPSVSLLKRMALTLNCDMDDLLPRGE